MYIQAYILYTYMYHTRAHTHTYTRARALTHTHTHSHTHTHTHRSLDHFTNYQVMNGVKKLWPQVLNSLALLAHKYKFTGTQVQSCGRRYAIYSLY